MKLLEGILDASMSHAEAAWAVQPRAATQRWFFMAWCRSHQQWDCAPWMAVAAHSSQQLPVYRQMTWQMTDKDCHELSVFLGHLWPLLIGVALYQ